MPLVPDDFVVPRELVTDRFRLEPPAPQHDERADHDPTVVEVHSWVRADRAALDQPLHEALSQWLAADRPLTGLRYAAR